MRKKGGVYSREAFSRGRAFIRSNTVYTYCKKKLKEHAGIASVQKNECLPGFYECQANIKLKPDELIKEPLFKKKISPINFRMH